jgi:deoxyribodipyrimidine photo-lyase
MVMAMAMAMAMAMPKQRALVWFKRDLRIHDHAALVAAQSHADALALFVIEPEWLQSTECDASHVDFALGCLAVEPLQTI